MRRAAKIDTNQPEIVNALRKAGATVQSLAAMWSCKQCGVEKKATVHQNRHTYCSKSCMAIAYSTRLLGANNPHHSDAGIKVCTHCGNGYHSYIKTRKFCSFGCYQESKPKTAIKKQMVLKLVNPPRVATPVVIRSTKEICFSVDLAFANTHLKQGCIALISAISIAVVLLGLDWHQQRQE